MGGKGDNPTYEEVCSGSTGHVEVAQVAFDAAKVSYRDLVKFFFTFHDPTLLNRQGNDRGTQYASCIFATSEEQKKVANEVIKELQGMIDSKSIEFVRARSFEGDRVTTQVRDAGAFFPAKEENQMYLAQNPGGYCNHSIRFLWE
jgi:peptide-methionine (S)-S-oxide reductase